MNGNNLSTVLRILLVEDNEHDRRIFRRAMQNGHISTEIIDCVRAEEALERLLVSPACCDLVVADYKLPGMSGLELCKEALTRKVGVPLVILTGIGTEQLAVEALKAGVDDYLVKESNHGYLELLPVVLADVMRRHHNRLARQRAEEELRKHHDYLEELVQDRTADLNRVNRQLRDEIAERIKAEKEIQYYLTLEQAVANASRLLVSAGDTDFNAVLKILGEAVSANRAYIFHFRENGRKMDNTYEWCSPGTEAQIDNLQDLDAAACPWWINKLEQGENIVIPEVDNLPPEATAEKAILHAQEIKSLLIVPIHSEEDLLGFMGFDDTEKCRTWQDQDAQTLRVIGEMVANIFERRVAEESLKKSRETLRNLAHHLEDVREEERTHLAREVHDLLGQNLTALRMELGWLSNKLSDATPSLRGKIKSMSDQIDKAIETVRNISTGLRPGLLDDFGLEAAVEHEVKDFKARTKIEVDFVSNLPDMEKDQAFAITLFRIVQELLTNVARHANASRVWLDLRQDADKVMLSVRDNGRGISHEQISDSRSLGLIGMRERIKARHGTLKIEGVPSQGTTVSVIIPLEKGTEHDDKSTYC